VLPAMPVDLNAVMRVVRPASSAVRATVVHAFSRLLWPFVAPAEVLGVIEPNSWWRMSSNIESWSRDFDVWLWRRQVLAVKLFESFRLLFTRSFLAEYSYCIAEEQELIDTLDVVELQDAGVQRYYF
jgi:hypothetical protein